MDPKSFPSGPLATKAYLVVCETTGKAAIIDPAPDSFQAVTNYLTLHKYQLEKILLTHSHWDHIADTVKFKEYFKIPVYIHEADQGNLEDPGFDGLPFPNPFQGVIPDHFLHEGDIVPIGDLRLKVIHTPGHTPGGICFYNEKEGWLISGDTLFRGTYGNISFPTSIPEAMGDSLKKLSNLPASTKVFPGHGLSTTIGSETWLAEFRTD